MSMIELDKIDLIRRNLDKIEGFASALDAEQQRSTHRQRMLMRYVDDIRMKLNGEEEYKDNEKIREIMKL